MDQDLHGKMVADVCFVLLSPQPFAQVKAEVAVLRSLRVTFKQAS
jgi:hypothetical protein